MNNSNYDNNLSDRLRALGFEPEDLEFMQFEAPDVTEDELVRKYLDIARDQNGPYKLNWDSEQTAMNTNEMLGVYKPNGETYRKHDIVQDTIMYFFDGNRGGAHRIHKKKRRTRKHRSNKRKHGSHKRRHRTRHRKRN